MKAVIAKAYLAAKQFWFFLGFKQENKKVCFTININKTENKKVLGKQESWYVLTKCFELKYMLRFHFAAAINWTTVFSCIIQCCELRQF